MAGFTKILPSEASQALFLQPCPHEDESIMPLLASTDLGLLPGLMVIDCFSRRVVAAQPDCDYVALSYVWGSTSRRIEDKSFDQDLQDKRLPQTVQDAMNVVLALNKRFLWVDRYCINGTDPGTKQYMISNMDFIYEAAYLTIIAASGSDGEHGLPRVSGSYKAQEGTTIPPWDGMICMWLFPQRLRQIETSTWSARGWTYQEALLSRRRLIFTDDWAILHFRGEDCVKASSGIFAHINEYCRRNLTYPSDTLKAFLGVFRAYENLRPPAMHIWGIPFLLDSDGNIRQPGYGLLWRNGMQPSLRRTEGVPSWTWAGCIGWSIHDDTESSSINALRRLIHVAPYIWLVNNTPQRRLARSWGPSDISLEVLVGGKLTNISNYFRACHRQPSGKSEEPAPVLYLTAWSTTVTVHEARRSSLCLDELGVNHVCKDKSRVNGCCSCSWTAAVICWHVSNEHARSLRTQSLLLKRVEEDTFRRVGILKTDWHKSEPDEHGRMSVSGRTFTRTLLRIV